MTNATQFRIATRPRLLLGTRLLDLVDAFPVQTTALITAVAAGIFAALVLA